MLHFDHPIHDIHALAQRQPQSLTAFSMCAKCSTEESKPDQSGLSDNRLVDARGHQPNRHVFRETAIPGDSTPSIVAYERTCGGVSFANRESEMSEGIAAHEVDGVCETSTRELQRGQHTINAVAMVRCTRSQTEIGPIKLDKDARWPFEIAYTQSVTASLIMLANNGSSVVVYSNSATAIAMSRQFFRYGGRWHWISNYRAQSFWLHIGMWMMAWYGSTFGTRSFAQLRHPQYSSAAQDQYRTLTGSHARSVSSRWHAGPRPAAF